jgi:urea transport system substrate-binding protein
MTDDTRRTGGSFSMTRRGALLGGAALTASLFAPKGLRAQDFPTSAVNTTGLAVTDTTATVGILHYADARIMPM